MDKDVTSRRMWIEYVPLKDVVRWPRNPKAHDLGGIGASFDRFGYADPIIRDDTSGKLVAGHGRLETLEEKERAGEDPPDRIVLDETGQWLVPVVRGIAFKDETEAEAYLLAHNHLTEKGGWIQDELDELLKKHAESIGGFSGMGWNPDTFLDEPVVPTPEPGPLEPTEEPQNAPQGQEDPDPTLDYIPEVTTPRAQPGDVWALGDHRILCGDAQERTDVDRLLGRKKAAMVLTDPPFAIYGSSSGIGADVADDKMIRPFFRGLCQTIQRILPRFGHAYIHCDWRSWSTIWWAMQASGLSPKNMIVWDKGDAGLGSSYIHCHELIAFCAKLPPAKTMKSSEKTGQRLVRSPNIVRHGRVHGEDRQHNAAKPVKVLIDLITNSSDPQDIVVDLFMGSGSTMIAAEQCGRACYSMELEPKWVDVSIARWEKLTGKKAKRMGPRTRKKKS